MVSALRNYSNYTMSSNHSQCWWSLCAANYRLKFSKSINNRINALKSWIKSAKGWQERSKLRVKSNNKLSISFNQRSINTMRLGSLVWQLRQSLIIKRRLARLRIGSKLLKTSLASTRARLSWYLMRWSKSHFKINRSCPKQALTMPSCQSLWISNVHFHKLSLQQSGSTANSSLKESSCG